MSTTKKMFEKIINLEEKINEMNKNLNFIKQLFGNVNFENMQLKNKKNM